MNIRFLVCAFFIMAFSACAPLNAIFATSTPINTSTPTRTATLHPTKTLSPTPTYTPTITPTPIGGGNGMILYTEGWTLYSIDTNGKNKQLIDENCSWNNTFSPDGRYMTCSVYKKIDDNDSGGFGVILVDLKTHRVVKRLVESARIEKPGEHPYRENTITFSWSPNSKLFAFIGTYQGETGLYVIDIESSNTTLLFKSPSLCNLKWSPGGTKILIFDFVDPAKWDVDLYVVNIDGTNLTQLTEKSNFFESVVSKWGNDDHTVFLNPQGVMYGLDLDTMQPNGETLPIPDPNTRVIPSPDNQFLLNVESRRNKLFLVSKDDSQKIDISKNFNVNYNSIPNFKWSPDGKYLAYYEQKDKTIVIMPIETLTVSPLVQVTVDEKSQWPYYYGRFLWLPDGKQIIYIQADESGGFVVNLVDLSGNVKSLFTTKYPVGIDIEPATQ